jgi:peptidoglycan/LPS O-acetylase OafA/YrhL
MNNKLIKLEAIRGFAAIYVVLHHTMHQFKIFNLDLSFLLRFGQEAVILFFILSGFVIEYSFSKGKDKTFKTYFFKRFLRIYIPLFCVFIANYIIKSLNNEVVIDWKILIGNIFMLQDIDFMKPNVIVTTFLGNSPLWSLSYEWWFYMLYFPLAVYLKNKSSFIVYMLGIISAMTYIVYPNFFNRELMYFSIWWSGVAIARLYTQSITINIKNLKYTLLTLLTLTIILSFNVYISNNISTVGIHPLLELRHFGFCLIAILLALLWKKMRWIGFSSAMNIFSLFAPISYGVYISHHFMISNISYLDNLLNNNILKYILAISICIGFSYIIERIIYVKINNLYKSKFNNRS